MRSSFLPLLPFFLFSCSVPSLSDELLTRRLLVNDGWAGTALQLSKSGDAMIAELTVFGSGLPVIAEVHYQVDAAGTDGFSFRKAVFVRDGFGQEHPVESELGRNFWNEEDTYSVTRENGTIRFYKNGKELPAVLRERLPPAKGSEAESFL